MIQPFFFDSLLRFAPWVIRLVSIDVDTCKPEPFFRDHITQVRRGPSANIIQQTGVRVGRDPEPTR
jgi:hypothetical protein